VAVAACLLRAVRHAVAPTVCGAGTIGHRDGGFIARFSDGRPIVVAGSEAALATSSRNTVNSLMQVVGLVGSSCR
jgi:hypothetical protein